LGKNARFVFTMKVFIFHYHLNPGGVTRVIDLQIDALKLAVPDVGIELITGACSNPDFYREKGVTLTINPELNYLAEPLLNLKKRFLRILNFFEEILPKDGILHFHNINLGKNPLITLAFYHLVENGYVVLNHTHDFSEDRPENQQFLEKILGEISGKPLLEILYPTAENYYLAVLNSSDYQRLSTLGIKEDRRFLLPNPVFFTEKKFSQRVEILKREICDNLGINPAKKIVTYPVRVIHRKNIAEFVLLASLIKSEANWIVTQPPKNPVELNEYNQWKEFCEKENIPIIWEAGNKVDFEGLVKISDYCITTSIREGFGMAYLEPWLLETPVIGRDLPSVTIDLKNSGLEFPRLYSNFRVTDSKEIHELPILEQMDIISSIGKIPGNREKIFQLNSFLGQLLFPVNKALILKNKGVILREYSLENYGQRLHEIYRRITGRA
jgi:glycosyltransferase involved in cell wall biosynthesis